MENTSTRNNDQNEDEEETGNELLYSIEDSPPWYLVVFLGLQQYMTMFGSTVTIPFLIAEASCATYDDLALGKLISTIFFVSGLVTFFQTTFGIRLPIIQGGTFSFLAPTIAILSSKRWNCEEYISDLNATLTSENSSMTEEIYTEIWQERLREIQGAIILASIAQILIGGTGILGLVLRFITPITIAPTIALVGLSLYGAATFNASQYWPISLLTIVLITVFSQYFRNFNIPCFKMTFNRAKKSKIEFGKARPIQIFKLFPIILAIGIVWFLCAILTVSVDLPENAQSIRTDLKMGSLHKSAWLRFPYPFQWGWPTFSASSALGMLAGVIASMIESIGDYYAAARFSGAKPPPTHAINRGIFFEGLGCILAGMWGTGNGTTSYSENIGAIGITKVGSRRVIQVAAATAMVFGVVGKIGGLFATIPSPIVGGVFFAMFGLITAVGISNLQLVDLNSSRNLYIIGLSLFGGLAIPSWFQSNPDAIQTGSSEADQIFTVLLSTSMFVGGVIAIFLDNTVPGTKKERGLLDWSAETASSGSNEETYDCPCGMGLLRKLTCFRFCPISPTFEVSQLNCRKGGGDNHASSSIESGL